MLYRPPRWRESFKRQTIGSEDISKLSETNLIHRLMGR